LSHQVRLLEKELGVTLFRRTKRSVELTHPGRIFLREAQRLLAGAADAVQAAQSAEAGQLGRLMVVCGPTTAYAGLLGMLQLYRRLSPRVDVRLLESPVRDAVVTVEQGNADVGLVVPYFESSLLARETVMELPLLAALPKSHPLASANSISLKQLSEDPFVLFGRQRGSGFYERVLSVCHACGFSQVVQGEPALMGASKPALRAELLFYLTFLVAFALLVGVATSLLALAIAPDRGVAFIVILVALEVGIFVLYGHSLVTRLVLRPLDRVMETADAVADGDLGARAPDAATRDFATLAQRLNRMTDRLLDAQSQLVRSETLASIGRLAAGVAHEVGNPLGAIVTYLEVLRRRGADQEVTAGIAREVERVDKIVRSLLDYARPQEDPLAPVDTARVARGAFELLRAQGAFRRLHVELDVGSDVPMV